MYGQKKEKKKITFLRHFSKFPQKKVIEKKSFVLKGHEGE